MARASKNSALNEISGQLGKQLVIKQYGDKTVISQYPDMDGVKPSLLQTHYQTVFAEAVAYAKHINDDRELKKKYLEKVRPRQSVYHYAMKEYLNKDK